MTVNMYAVASSIDDDGWQVADGRTPNELTSWVAVTPRTVSLDPGESKTVTVQIDVPADASKGDAYARVEVQLPSHLTPEEREHYEALAKLGTDSDAVRALGTTTDIVIRGDNGRGQHEWAPSRQPHPPAF